MDFINLPIDAIAAFNSIGIMKPLYFRMEDDHHIIKTLTVREVLSQKEEKYAATPMISYLCKVELADEEKLCELKFNIITHRWKLYQITNLNCTL